jgi:kynurenine formamidase
MTSQWVDLSLPIESDMPRFAGTPPVYIAHSHRLDVAGFNMRTVTLGTHAGTHLDAPSHFLSEGNAVDELEFERCVGEAFVLDLSHKSALDQITVRDLQEAGAASDELNGRRLILRTDWDLRFRTAEYFTDYPALAPQSAEWLAASGIWLLGLDIPSLHPTEFVTMHEVLLGEDVAIVESLANLRSLSASHIFFSALPLRLAGADGAPVRAVAYDGWPL